MSAEQSIRKGILDTLRYFDIFNFPLNSTEIHRFIAMPCVLNDVEKELSLLLEEGALYSFNDNYLLKNDEKLVLRKRKGFELSKSKLKEANLMASIIYAFPFVEMVGVSGSLSKGYFDKGSDIDFFIVTKSNRLWVARTLLHVMKKMSYVIGKQHSLCMNYFIDDNALELDDKNYFTAIELGTLIPLFGFKKHEELINKNQWIYNYVPNITLDLRKRGQTNSFFANSFKSLFEFVFNSGKLNAFLMKLTDKKWRKKWSKRGFDMTKYDRAFKTTLHISKNHPNNYQEKIMEKYR